MIQFAIISIYIWIGFVCAISFMEAWLKFRAPGVSLAIGLGIGQLVFSALNRVEWTLTLIISVVLFLNIEHLPVYIWIVLGLPLILLTLQSIYLLPKLKLMAKAKIEGKSSQNPSVHIYYVIFELIKVITLACIGYMLFKF